MPSQTSVRSSPTRLGNSHPPTSIQGGTTELSARETVLTPADGLLAHFAVEIPADTKWRRAGRTLLDSRA